MNEKKIGTSRDDGALPEISARPPQPYRAGRPPPRGMNKGGGERARAEKAAREGRGRGRGRGPGLKRGAPSVASASARGGGGGGGGVELLNARVPVPGEPPPLPPRRAASSCAAGAGLAEEEDDKGASGLRGWRGFDDASAGAFDGLGVVPGAAVARGFPMRAARLLLRAGDRGEDVLHMADDAQDAVSALLRELRPPEIPRASVDAASAKRAREAEAMARRNLTRDAAKKGAAQGLAVDASIVPTGRAALLASSDDVLDQLAAQEAHAVARGEAAARAGRARARDARLERERRVREERVRTRIVDRGFDVALADDALRHCPEDAKDFDAEEAEEEDARARARRQRNAVDARLAAALDWLCLHAPKVRLVPIRPRWRGERRSLRTFAVVSLRPHLAFNTRPRCLSTPTDAFQLHPDIIFKASLPPAFVKLAARPAEDAELDLDVSGRARAAMAADAEGARGGRRGDGESEHVISAAGAPADPYVALLQRAMLARIQAAGFSRAEAREALEDAGWIEEDATYALLRGLQPVDARDDDDDDDARAIDASSNGVVVAAEERAEEALALAAILDDAFAEHAGSGSSPDAGSSPVVNMWTVSIAPDDDRWRPCVLEVHFPPGCEYPAEAPLLSVRQPNLPPPMRRSIAAQLAAQAASARGEPVVYTLVAWLQEHLPAILDEHGEMDEEAAARAASAAAEEEAAAEAAAAAAAGEAGNALSGRSHIERTFAKLETKRDEDAREEADRQRRMAYFRRLLEEEKEAEEEEEEEEEELDDDDDDDDVLKERRSPRERGRMGTSHDDDDDDDSEDEEDERTSAAVERSTSTPPPPDAARVMDADASLEDKLTRWEEEHKRRVAAAEEATAAAVAAVKSRKIIQPNTVLTAAAVAAAEAAKAKEAEETCRREREEEESKTARGRRAKARAELYEGKGAAAAAAAAAAGDKKSSVSWLTKHVKNMGWGDEEGVGESGAAGDADGAGDDALEPDEVAAAAAASLAGVSAVRAAADAAAAAEAAAADSERLLAAEKRKRADPKWIAMQAKRRELPAHAMRAEVLACIASGPASVVSGATGCGKSTQVPQFLLEDAIRAGRGGECSVIITQPRRLSAIAVAERVASERCERIGDVVGYSIRLESKQSARTRLLFCTTGILLRRLQSDPDLVGVTHVVVDEVHERDLLSDFLLVILRALAKRRNDPPFRVVAMSATVNAELFQTYFERVLDDGPCGAVEIPGRTFPVAEYRLEDAIEATGYVCEPDGEYALGSDANKNANGGRGGGRTFGALSGGGGGARGRAARAAIGDSLEKSSMLEDVTEETRAMYPGYSESTMRCLQTIDEDVINMELIESLIAHIADEYEDGAILVFLPGMAEIRGLHERLVSNLDDVETRFTLIPLHSTLSSEEQRLTFSVPPPGVRKIVMATNIAETSITIDDVVFVIDAGRVRETRYDPASRMSSLVTAWCSKASSRQRRGRAGRVREGYCFHLYSSRKERELAAFTTPEILRTPLDALCLQIKVLKLGDVREFLSQAIEPPPEESIASALASLAELDAVDASDELTPLGRHLAELPVDARLGKMILYGAMFSCLDPVLTIAASVGFRSPFLAPIDKRDEADEAKRKLAGAGASSDHLTLVRAYAGWIRARARGRGFERDFLSKTFLSAQTLKQISEMRQQYVQLLDQIGFLRSGTGMLGGASKGKEKEDEDDGEEKTDAAMKAGDEPSASGDGASLDAAAAPFVPGGGRRPPPPPPPRGGRAPNDRDRHRGGRSTRAAAAALELASANATNEPLVRAVICAGLYPNVALAEPKTAETSRPGRGGRGGAQTKISVRTKGDGEVSLHPTSICFGASAFEHRFLLYHEKVRTTKVYIRDATMVGAYPLLLFGGKVKVDHERSSASVDGWIRFRAAPRVAVLFKALRAELDGLLMRKIASPELNIAAKSGDLVRQIVELLENEDDATRAAKKEARDAEAATRAAAEATNDD